MSHQNRVSEERKKKVDYWGKNNSVDYTKGIIWYGQSSNYVSKWVWEIEALTVVDVLRRAEIEVSDGWIWSKSDRFPWHHSEVDEVWSGSLDHFDGIVLPGEVPGAANLRDHEAWFSL